MENPEVLFKKIDAREREWASMVTQLQLRSVELNPNARVKFEKQINKLNTRLKEVQKLNNRLKNASIETRSRLGDDVLYSWVESLVKIDNAVLYLKNKLE